MLVVVLTVAAVDAEVAADELWGLGVGAVEQRNGPDANTSELWTSLGDDENIAAAALEMLRWPWRFEYVDESVSQTWRAYATPTWVAPDLVVVPAWTQAPADLGRAITLTIDPGATFGMGDHPTTMLSLRALRAAMAADADVLDVGCGSGILAIAACRFGARTALAIDIAAAAPAVTAANAARNGVSNAVRSANTPLADIDETFDVVIANILAPTLIELAGDLRRVLAVDGTLIISGILAERHAHVLDALVPLRVVAREDLDGWTAISLQR